MKQGYLSQAWLVLVMALCVGAALAGVYVSLNERILSNAEADALSRVPSLIKSADPGKTRATKPEIITVARPDGTTLEYRVYRAIDKGDQLAGWVIKAGGEGFAGRIELLIAVDPTVETILGLAVLEQKESPTVGDKIAKPFFQDRFANKKTRPALAVVKGEASKPNEIRALSGATISAQAVTTIVNAALGDLAAELAKRAGAAPAAGGRP